MVAETIQKISPQFKLGTKVVAQQAHYTIQEMVEKKFGEGTIGAIMAAESIKRELLKRHLQLRQGELCQSDWKLNQEAVNRVDSEGKPDPEGDLRERIFSAFKVNDVKFYVITEWDESSTCILLPDEY